MGIFHWVIGEWSVIINLAYYYSISCTEGREQSSNATLVYLWIIADPLQAEILSTLFQAFMPPTDFSLLHWAAPWHQAELIQASPSLAHIIWSIYLQTRGLAALQKALGSLSFPPIARYPPPKSFITASMPRTMTPSTSSSTLVYCCWWWCLQLINILIIAPFFWRPLFCSKWFFLIEAWCENTGHQLKRSVCRRSRCRRRPIGSWRICLRRRLRRKAAQEVHSSSDRAL